LFKKILIANRGEIAVRIIRACQEMKISTVAVYSEADADSLHVKLADESYCIGPAAPAGSYLNIPAIISTAEVSGAEAIHPGYGFLAENARFSEVCEAHNIVFIGPSAEAINRMGDKAEARKTMMAAKVPVTPGTKDLIKDESEIPETAEKLGYPVIMKATAGGGGKGMRVGYNEAEAINGYKMAKAEAAAAFGNDGIYMEKYILQPRHIEVQILGDSHGNVIHLGERECSIQRRHQKILEEAPSIVINDEQRKAMGDAAVRAAKAVKYVGAGTIEFIMDKDLNYYFMEMNTRIQVEHCVTEMITDIDIVKEQIRVASGEKLKHTQKDVKIKGHAIEFRINAENPDKNFMPSPGKVDLYLPSGGFGVRVDSHLYPGYVVSPTYDSMLAKLIVWGETRQEAIDRGKRALDEFVVSGVHTIIPFQQKILENEHFLKGEVFTDFIEKRMS
jgi:acetyl-CoA carboxylase, biotin carboxylase subunit